MGGCGYVAMAKSVFKKGKWGWGTTFQSTLRVTNRSSDQRYRCLCVAIADTSPAGIGWLTEYISSARVTCTRHRYTDIKLAGKDLDVIGMLPNRGCGKDCMSRYVTSRVEYAFMYNWIVSKHCGLRQSILDLHRSSSDYRQENPFASYTVTSS